MANIKDIAKIAGVSVSTVSRVINNHPYVKEEKKQAVLEAIEKTNYQQNINAIHLSKGKTFLIGVVVPFNNHPYFGLLIEGIAKEAMTHHYKLVLFQTNYEEEKELEALNMLKHKQIDALIICSRKCSWGIIEEFVSYGNVVVCEDSKRSKISSTYINHYESFMKALEYLHKKGHRKIGYCIGRRESGNSNQRNIAYRDFLFKMNETYNSSYIFHECYNLEDGKRVVDQLSEMPNRPTALLVTSDQVAAGIITCSKEQNLAIPDDLAIMGFDNQPIAKIMNITTLEIPLVEMGRKLFLQAMEHGTISHEEITVKLMERASV
ncbi:LacI family DNA-binding transcriptional regulator [Sutcliffiella halmapala]|uniref:LacI family DNA-binding transcriptional regulator n=1 Tax=Sutcliffiella halmapala TaxID=79882 RepID=UPI000995BCCE|nr:LacI family DNA-binding transcriptional regulator [Sutcliffiella halmapala]